MLLDDLLWNSMDDATRTKRIAARMIKEHADVGGRRYGSVSESKVKRYIKRIYSPRYGTLAKTVEDVIAEYRRQKKLAVERRVRREAERTEGYSIERRFTESNNRWRALIPRELLRDRGSFDNCGLGRFKGDTVFVATHYGGSCILVVKGRGMTTIIKASCRVPTTSRDRTIRGRVSHYSRLSIGNAIASILPEQAKLAAVSGLRVDVDLHEGVVHVEGEGTTPLTVEAVKGVYRLIEGKPVAIREKGE